MKKGQNFNHPKKGSRIKVEPIRKLKDIKLIKKILQDKPLDYALFVIGINTNLRASDILSLFVAQVKFVKPGDSFEIKEKKTGKARQVTFNQACVEAVQPLIKKAKSGNWDFLFTGKGGVWKVPAVSQKVKQWCKEINLRGNYGSHTLRKTWGYHQYRTFKTPLPVLMVCFNHRKQEQTLQYLTIENEEIKNVFMNSI